MGVLEDIYWLEDASNLKDSIPSVVSSVGGDVDKAPVFVFGERSVTVLGIVANPFAS